MWRRARMTTALLFMTSALAAEGAVQIVPSQTTLTVLDLPVPSSPYVATAWAVNSTGQIVGWFSAGPDATASPRGFLGTVAGPTSVFPVPQVGQPYAWVQPYDINPSGVIVGQAR